MDKETLSNYGWIVICVLVLAVMIALASPFGEFVSSAVKNTTTGLFGVNQEALGAAGIVIDDQTFCEHKNQETVNAKESTYTEQGWEEYIKCTDCGKALTADGKVPVLPLLKRTEPTDLGVIEWDELISASEDGSYIDKYIVGDLVTLIMKDNSTAQFRIVGIDHDDLTSGGKAHLTLVSERTLVNHSMNAASTNAGGWEDSAMRAYLNGDYMNTMIPDSALSAIKEVSKKSFDYDTQASQTTSDKLWIPSYTEVGCTSNTTITGAEGGSAYAYFTDATSRTKKNLSNTDTWWWLRSANSGSGNNFHYVGNRGTYSDYFANTSHGVALGFCI